MCTDNAAGRERPPETPETEPIPISALQHAVYCLRQAALIHLERLWADNRLTAEGHVLHTAADLPGRRKVRGIRRVSALPVASRRLGMAGVADLVEFRPGSDGEIPFPIEIKRGKPKPHRADAVQLCAQGLCLEEMTGVPVPAGALYYAQTKRREEVVFDAELRAFTEATAAELRRIFTKLETPPPTPHKSRCRACSLNELCRPASYARPVYTWRRQMVETALADSGA